LGRANKSTSNMTPNEYIEWLDKMIAKTEKWKGSSVDFHMQRSTQIAVFKQVKQKFLTIEYPTKEKEENNFVDGLSGSE
jgi:hypothetical protein